MQVLRRVALAMALVVVGAACAPDTAEATGAARPVAIGAGLTGPAGLSATIYAHGPTQVSALAVDPQGRLWLSTAASEDAGTDGVYLVPKSGAAPVAVIGDLHTPLGLLWYQGSLYVSSKERVDAYGGFDGTAFATHRTVLTLPAGVGESNGLVLAPDGRIQMGISAPCDSCTVTSEYSATIVSFEPDGTDLQVDVSTIRAAVGLAYYPHTSDLFVSVNQRDNLGTKTPGDWLALVRKGQSWKFPECYGQGGSACAGVPVPVGVLDQHAGADGVAIVTGQLGPTVGNSALVAEWATGKVKAVALAKHGATYSGRVSTLISGLVHAVPVVVGSDGGVFVGDWGTGIVYRITRR
jgi:glucose/arabinose dehydrogenase